MFIPARYPYFGAQSAESVEYFRVCSELVRKLHVVGRDSGKSVFSFFNFSQPLGDMNMRIKLRSVALASLLAIGFTTSVQATVVYANAGPPGDAYTNAGSSNQGQAVGSSGWYYNNVRNGGVAGIDTTYARSGNGSVHMSGTAGPGGASFKADIEYLAGGVPVAGNYYATGSLGLFSAFSGMAYDWYRNSSSTNSVLQHPALRIMLDTDGDVTTINDRGYLIYELAYNGGGAVATNTWTHETIGANSKLWNAGLGFGTLFDIDGVGGPFDDSLSEWQSAPRMANAVILGFSAGVGSGWGPFDGAVDNISWTIGNVTTTTNFEVARAAVPEPGSLALMGLALAGLAAMRRRKGV